MRYSVIFLIAFLTAAVNAHFQIQFPPPRQPYNATKQTQFCDGITTPSANRTQFPLSGGYITVRFGHSNTWTAGIMVSTSQNPTRFEDFVVHNGFGRGNNPGNYCIPLDFSKTNVTGLSANQNITIQFVFSGGDGELFQCADLVLANGVDISSIPCTNSTTTPSSSAGPSPTASSSFATPTNAKSITSLTALVALAGLLLL